MSEKVDLWFDAVCPWAWMTSRWLLEAAAVRDLQVTFRPMSLAVLNEDQDIPEEYRRVMDAAWGPARVVVATREQHGDEAVGRLYTELGERIHVAGRGREDATVIPEALEAAGLPAELAEAAATDRWDEQLRASHAEGISRVGQDVGTPVIAVGETAFFGPVVTPAPRGEAAGLLWDGVLLVARTPGFFELKRTRDAKPDFS